MSDTSWRNENAHYPVEARPGLFVIRFRVHVVPLPNGWNDIEKSGADDPVGKFECHPVRHSGASVLTIRNDLLGTLVDFVGSFDNVLSHGSFGERIGGSWINSFNGVAISGPSQCTVRIEVV